jgi:hypothetical protein
VYDRMESFFASKENNHSSKGQKAPAETSKLDTYLIAKTLSKTLSANKISKQLFAKEICDDMPQQYLNEILRKPKPWSECSHALKNAYQTINNWINSEEAILLLSATANKKKRNSLK